MRRILRIWSTLLGASPLWLPCAGLTVGLWAGMVHFFAKEAPARAFLGDSGWQFGGFSGFGAMSGFSLAALALLVALQDHPRAVEVLDANPGRFLVRMLVRAVWGWMVPAAIALVAMAVPGRILEALFLVAAPVALGQGLVALIALSLFFERFHVPRPGP